MLKTTAYILSNGVIYTDWEMAKRAAENRFGAALSKLAHAVVAVEKYNGSHEWIEENLHKFIEIEALKKDIAIEQPE